MVKRAVILGAFALAAACGDPTIRVYTEAEDGSSVGAITIGVGRDGDDAHDEDTGPEPTVLLIENADTSDDRDVVIVVKGFDQSQNGTEFVRRTARLPFDVEDVVVNMSLCTSCAGVDCGGGKTCVKGSCIDIDNPDVDTYDGPDSLPSLECGGSGGGGGGGGGPGCEGTCSMCGDMMCPDVPVTTNGNYFISQTEVTRAQFAEFVASGDTPPDMPAECDGFALSADADCMMDPDVIKGGDEAAHPQVCVTWCAAKAYCKWLNWDLCSEGFWDSACGGDSMPPSTYPYSDTYDPQACRGAEFTANQTTFPAGSIATCIGSLPDLFDMSGNVAEWTDDGGNTVRGGHYQSDAINLTCIAHLPQLHDEATPRTGFRCCY